MDKMLQEKTELESGGSTWADEFPGAITICDPDGIIIYMNHASEESFRKSGGASLVGTNLLDCHPEPSQSKLKNLLVHPMENIYTIEKQEIKKIIMQVPWFSEGQFRGLIEISKEVPFEMQHFIRK